MQEPEPYMDGSWPEGSPEYLERYEYIEVRAEDYLSAYSDDPGYDFNQTGDQVSRQQAAVQIAFEKYAEGSLTAQGVGDQVRMLRIAFRKQ